MLNEFGDCALPGIPEGWTAHDAGECPVPLDSRPAILWGDGQITEPGIHEARLWSTGRDSWKREGCTKNHIIAYREQPQ